MDAKVTIIVVTHNTAKWFDRQKDALENLTGLNWDAIYVDNASRVEERPLEASLPNHSKLIQSESNLGFAAANNLAATQTDAQYLLFLNPDAFPGPDSVLNLVRTLQQHPEAAAIGATLVRPESGGRLDGCGDVLHVSGVAYRAGRGKKWPIPAFGETFSACAAGMLIRRECFEAVGGFDERFFCYFEDVDLGFRLRLMNWTILQASCEACIEHVGGGGLTHSSVAEYYSARNRVWTFVKCMPAELLWFLLPCHIAMLLATATWAALRRGDLSVWRGVIDGIRGIEATLRTRAVVQAGRTASIDQIARALAWSPMLLITQKPVRLRTVEPSL